MRGEPPLWPRPRTPRVVDVLGLGQCALDQVATVPRQPPRGGKARVSGWLERPGGQVATALLAAARLGRSTALVASVGDDAAAAAVLSPLREAGVDVTAVRAVPGARTQAAMIWVDEESGERTVLWHREAALALGPEDVPAEAIAHAGVLLLDAGDPVASLTAARRAQAAGTPVVLDADTAVDGLEELLAEVDFPILAEELARALWGGAEEAARRLAASGAELAVVTLGARGAVACGADGLVTSPAFEIAPVDTTGAGDAFHGAFCDGLLAGLGPRDILRWSNAVAALNCLALGAQAGLPDAAAVERFLREDERRAQSSS